MKITQTQLEQVNDRMQALIRSNSFYGKKLEAAGMTEVHTPEEFAKLPFSEKKDLRDAYPLGLMAVPEEEIVRIHSSSGTTGTPVIIPYTVKDVDDWAIQFKRCYETAGITKKTGFRSHRATVCGQPVLVSRTVRKSLEQWSFPWDRATPRSSCK